MNLHELKKELSLVCDTWPKPELDRVIARHFIWPYSNQQLCRDFDVDPTVGDVVRTIPYTSSIDAAVTLVPREWNWDVTMRDQNSMTAADACYWKPMSIRFNGQALTAALALCIVRVEYAIWRAGLNESK